MIHLGLDVRGFVQALSSGFLAQDLAADQFFLDAARSCSESGAPWLLLLRDQQIGAGLGMAVPLTVATFWAKAGSAMAAAKGHGETGRDGFHGVFLCLGGAGLKVYSSSGLRAWMARAWMSQSHQVAKVHRKSSGGGRFGVLPAKAAADGQPEVPTPGAGPAWPAWRALSSR